MIEKVIVDADICIKLSQSKKYEYLYEVLPLIAKEIYIHKYVDGEVLTPREQLDKLISEGKVKVVNEDGLDAITRAIYDATYKNLSNVMIDPNQPNKNKGEVCSLAYAKATSISIFATDKRNLQPIIDKQLNTGIDNIQCIRIEDIVIKAQKREIALQRKYAKALWVIAGKDINVFDAKIWPIDTKNY